MRGQGQTMQVTRGADHRHRECGEESQDDLEASPRWHLGLGPQGLSPAARLAELVVLLLNRLQLHAAKRLLLVPQSPPRLEHLEHLELAEMASQEPTSRRQVLQASPGCSPTKCLIEMPRV
mmetsp:Transcript_64220/g.139715  ORF Transcript_64220/g.139715 Transcript_64220/m.139715 type:complete len:121 (-) Transcript_64220:735-1097(-)